jgi:hypothetical protein
MERDVPKTIAVNQRPHEVALEFVEQELLARERSGLAAERQRLVRCVTGAGDLDLRLGLGCHGRHFSPRLFFQIPTVPMTVPRLEWVEARTSNDGAVHGLHRCSSNDGAVHGLHDAG